jgi:hypothetical protein
MGIQLMSISTSQFVRNSSNSCKNINLDLQHVFSIPGFDVLLNGAQVAPHYDWKCRIFQLSGKKVRF